MSEKTGAAHPDNTTSALSHLAFCALIALGLARQAGIAGTPVAENLFLIRWLATAQKQRHCCKNREVINSSTPFADGAAHEPLQRPAFSA